MESGFTKKGRHWRKEDEDEEITWVKQDNIINTINYMKKASCYVTIII